MSNYHGTCSQKSEYFIVFQEEGLYMWRIDNFLPLLLDDAVGRFYEADCYIILHVSFIFAGVVIVLSLNKGFTKIKSQLIAFEISNI